MKNNRNIQTWQEKYLAYQPFGSEDRDMPEFPEWLVSLYQLLSKEAGTADLSDSLRWNLAGVLLDFAIDLQDGIGLWTSYEQYNRQWFGTPLPVTLGDEISLAAGIQVERIRHLLWVIMPEIVGESCLFPDDKDLEQLSRSIYSLFTDESFLPKGSGIKNFLQTSNQFGWDIKRKLVWLGSKSYLFRLFYQQYLDEHNNGKFDIGHTDDFICQECSVWSGLGAIDILAGVLQIREEERKELQGWYERHFSAYLILSANKEKVVASNIINDQNYTIGMNDDRIPFKKGQLVIGSVTPWRGEWFWSGQQRVMEKPSTQLIADFKENLIRRSSSIIYRYCPDREIKARQMMAEIHAESLRYHGNDLVIYPDGLAMASDWQREIRQKWEAQSPEIIKDVMTRHKMKKPCPDISLPEDLLNAENGLGVFLNPDEGKEIMEQFDDLVEGFQRKGVDLTQEQEEIIQGFIRSEAISPAFVKRVVKEYGDDSLKVVFRMQNIKTDSWLDYLLRRYKGHFYRKRYPSITIAG